MENPLLRQVGEACGDGVETGLVASLNCREDSW